MWSNPKKAFAKSDLTGFMEGFAALQEHSIFAVFLFCLLRNRNTPNPDTKPTQWMHHSFFALNSVSSATQAGSLREVKVVTPVVTGI